MYTHIARRQAGGAKTAAKGYFPKLKIVHPQVMENPVLKGETLNQPPNLQLPAWWRTQGVAFVQKLQGWSLLQFSASWGLSNSVAAMQRLNCKCPASQACPCCGYQAISGYPLFAYALWLKPWWQCSSWWNNSLLWSRAFSDSLGVFLWVRCSETFQTNSHTLMFLYGCFQNSSLRVRLALSNWCSMTWAQTLSQPKSSSQPLLSSILEKFDLILIYKQLSPRGLFDDVKKANYNSHSR